jgi:RNA polymerase sigma-70 factor (ECF subfamily)
MPFARGAQQGGPMTDHSIQATDVDAQRIFDQQRVRLLAVAYRMLGSLADAEDVVQDTWLRWANVDTAEVAEPRAFLVRVTTRLALDRLRRVRARREEYIGPWLPEPLLTTGDAAEKIELAESVSMALLVVLETLSPLERTVFVLREAFAYPYAEIAAILDRGEPAVRQLAHRARDHVHERRPRFDIDQTTRQDVTERFLAACADGDMQALLGILAPDVTLLADGGGVAPAPLRPILGADKVARFLVAVAPEPLAEAEIHHVQLNGEPSIVVSMVGAPVVALLLDVAGGAVQTVYLVANPAKLSGVLATKG